MAASPLMTVMIAAARKAGKSLSRDFGEVENLQVSIKGPANFVSAADHRAEQIVFDELSHARPGYGFLMEERGEVVGADKTNRWIVDPLDGTTNFLHSNPLFSIAIALEREGQIVAGIIYNPIMDEMFMAEKGKGAFMADKSGRDRRLRVAARKTLDDALITTGIPHRGPLPAASTPTGNARSVPGTLPLAPLLFAKPAASSPTSTAAPKCSPKATFAAAIKPCNAPWWIF
jgi:myo-inositol-1(or 4)-monophosphatase